MSPGTQFANLLVSFCACKPAQYWVAGRTLPEAWRDCNKAEWLLWLAVAFGVDHRTIVLASAACSREALVFVPKGEDRPRLAIEAMERGEPQEVLNEHFWACLEAAKGVFGPARYAMNSAGCSPSVKEPEELVWEIDCAVRYAVMAGCRPIVLADLVRKIIPLEMIVAAFEKTLKT